MPAAIPREKFIENWLDGMHADSALVGRNWDGELGGLGVEPKDRR